MKARLLDILHFLRVRLWQIRPGQVSRRRFFAFKYLKILVLAARGFVVDKCMLRASALTFYTLLAIVPVCAMAFGVAKGFNFEDNLRASLLQLLPGHQDTLDGDQLDLPKDDDGTTTSSVVFADPSDGASTAPTVAVLDDTRVTSTGLALGAAGGVEGEDIVTQQDVFETVLVKVIDYAYKLLAESRGGLIGGIGFALLLWTVLKVLASIETSFNAIWGVKRARDWKRKFSDYLSFALVAPALVVMASSINVTIEATVGEMLDKFEALDYFRAVIIPMFGMLPVLFVWMLLAFVYGFFPNTRVRPMSALLAGLLAGVAYQVVQVAFIRFQFGVSKYNAVYGTFAALPLFLIWVQVSWVITLMGAELCFAHQNIDSYDHEPEKGRASHSARRLLAVLVTRHCAKRFVAGEPASTSSEITLALECPIRLLREVLFDLCECGILSETRGKDEEDPGYQPAQSTDGLTLSHVVDLFDNHGSDHTAFGVAADTERVINQIALLRQSIEHVPDNCRVQDI